MLDGALVQMIQHLIASDAPLSRNVEHVRKIVVQPDDRILIVGAIAGWLAGLIVKGGGFGLLGNIVIGIVGAVG